MSQQMLRSPKDNHHSGQFIAWQAEQNGATVTDTECGYKISAAKGDVYVPNRELHPCEVRHSRALLKLIGIAICLVAMVAYVAPMIGG